MFIFDLDEFVHKIEGNNMTIYGSIVAASDAKQMQTPHDILRGLALDYAGGRYVNYPNGPYYQVRYTTKDFSNAKIPVSEMDDYIQSQPNWREIYAKRDIEYPFTGNGFVPEGPELFSPGQQIEEALIVKISPDGTEVPVAVKRMGNDVFEILLDE